MNTLLIHMKKAAATFLIITLFISASPLPAYALFVPSVQPVHVINDTSASALTTVANTGVTAANTTAIQTKETLLDAVGWALVNGVLAAMVQSITDWVNNGFEGGPAFVTDLDQFLGQIADETALDFIEGTELGFLCSPFELEIRLALAVQRRPFQDRIRCSLGDVVDNVDRFFSGDFSGGGGWPAWFRVHAYQRNNPYGAYALSLAELEVRIDSRRSNEKSLLTFGSGFFSKRECVEYEAPATTHAEVQTGGPACKTWKIVTPGAQVNETLAKALGVSIDRLTVADEIDELVNALFAQLAQQALTGLRGLRGLSDRSSSSSRTYVDAEGRLIQGSYVEALGSETNQTATQTVRQSLLIQIERSIDTEEAYRTNLRNVSTLLRGVTAATFECYYAPSDPQSIENQLDVENALELAAYYDTEIEAVNATIGALEELRDSAAQANTSSALNNVSQAYADLVASGTLHSAADITAAGGEYENIIAIENNPEEFCEAETVTQ